MDVDFSIELGHDDPVLDFPWRDPAGKIAYFDLKRHPDLIASIPETQEFPELAEFLLKLNSARSALESAKCDVWSTSELSPEEDIFAASHKIASYVDLVFSDTKKRMSFDLHQSLAKKLTELLRRAPALRSAIEICLRRCFFLDKEMEKDKENVREGFYFTVYTNGYGNDNAEAHRNWTVALQLVGNALMQLSSTR